MELKNLPGKIIHSLLFCLVLVSNLSAADTSSKPIVCYQQYALCTSAPCVPDPANKTHANCLCDVLKGNSVGYTTCAERKTMTTGDKISQIVSTFSFAQFATKKFVSCKAGLPWTNCVDSPCTIAGSDPTHAVCNCPIVNTEAFFTLGGDCNTASCNNLWSGATPAMGEALQTALKAVVKGTHEYSSVTPEFCPTH
jgi:hypothetical protein